MTTEQVINRAQPRGAISTAEVDPITTEVIRQSLNSAAEQMKRALVRTAFSPIIYEALDFAVALYDSERRLLAQAPSLPIFMGTLNYCLEAAVDAVGGPDALDPGDIVLYNIPYGSGSHPQDVASVMPAFVEDVGLVGYAVVKAHWLDMGGKDTYSTDTIDVYQEGTLYPGVRLYRRGELNEDIYRIFLANSRVPKLIGGDLNAGVVGVRTGVASLERIVRKFGPETFEACVERMFDHGESVVRSYLEAIPDGRYVGRGVMDSNGVEPDKVPFDVVVEVEGSSVRVDYSLVPDAQVGPINCPVASTVSASRVAISLLAGGGEAPNEGHFRPIEVVTRPGSMFHPLSPSPTFLYAWPALQAIEVIYQSVAQAVPDLVPACSGGDLCGLAWWGVRESSGEPWTDGPPHPLGQGAHRGGDGASSLMHLGLACCRLAPVEVWEAKTPIRIEQLELAVDSGGPGRQRGGLGLDVRYRAEEICWLTSTFEHTMTPPWGLAGGGDGRANSVTMETPDGLRETFGKRTRMRVYPGTVVEVRTGGGGGFGDPAERDAEAVQADIIAGYVTLDHARRHYPHAVAPGIS